MGEKEAGRAKVQINGRGGRAPGQPYRSKGDEDADSQLQTEPVATDSVRLPMEGSSSDSSIVLVKVNT